MIKKFGIPKEDNDEVTLYKLKATYCQNGSDDEINEITLETRDDGGGIYIELSTNRWQLENINELELIFKDFKKKALI